VKDTAFLLNTCNPSSPLTLPRSSSLLLRICVLRTEDNPVYGACILPAFQELFREAGRERGREGGVLVELVDWLVKKDEYPPRETWEEYDGEKGGREGDLELPKILAIFHVLVVYNSPSSLRLPYSRRDGLGLRPGRLD